MVKVLIVGHEAIGRLMTGPSVRCWELASALAGEFDVTVAVPEALDVSPRGFRLATYRRDAPDDLESLAAATDAILVSGYLLRVFPFLGRLARPLVVDVYDPFPIENLELHREREIDEQLAISQGDFAVLEELLRAGDFFICGSERQRDFWLGMLAACGRVNPRTYAADPSFRDLVDVVPMGIPDSPPVVGSGSLKGVVPGIERDDFLLIWPGGVWDWLDPLTAVEAVHLVAGEAPDVKLYFPGLRHPHPEGIGAMALPDRVLRRAEELGLLGSRVFYRAWTPYADRAGYLADADAALSLHRNSVEAHLAIRARLLDCIWSRTPVIATEGDVVAEAMAQRDLATLVRPSSAQDVAEAILRWRSAKADRSRLAKEFSELAAEYSWSNVCRPLARFLREPRAAPDHAVSRSVSDRGSDRAATQSPSLPRQRWTDDAVLGLPFDQYQRHRQAAVIVESFRKGSNQPLRILDVGGGPAVTKRFLSASDVVVTVDLHPEPGALSIAGDATRLPFANEAFDFVVTLDTIEHLPSVNRARMIDECIRVARQGFILIAPVFSDEAVAAENLLFEFIRHVLHAEHDQLREHLQNGLPAQRAIEDHLRRLGYPYLVRPSGYIHHWLGMMLLKHFVMSLPQAERLHRQIDTYYNRFRYEADQRSPSYRALVFVAKSGDPADVERARRALQQDAAGVPDNADDLRALATLGLLAQIIGFKTRYDLNGGASPIAHAQHANGRAVAQIQALQRDLEDTRATLRQREAELTAAHELLDRIAHGRVMRLMNGFHAAVGRLRR